MYKHQIQEIIDLKKKIEDIEVHSENEEMINDFNKIFEAFLYFKDKFEEEEQYKEDAEYKCEDLEEEIGILEGDLEYLKNNSIQIPFGSIQYEYVFEKVNALLYKYGPYKLEEKLNNI